LLNLQDDVPAGFDAFSRVVEIVSLDEHDRRQARLRWKRYTDLGYAITQHDIARQGA
jgi:DNA polymerase-3 subunit chi